MFTVALLFSCVLGVRGERVFAILAGTPPGAEADLMGEELWYVKLANDDVHRVTLDQLDGAFQAGHINESTMVLAAGAERWAKLGDLLGSDDQEEAPAAPPQPIAHPAPPAYAPTVSYATTTPQRAPAPVASMAPIARAPAIVPNSLRPMSMDLEDVDFEAKFQRKSRKGWAVAMLGLVAVAGGVGFAATRAHGGGSGLIAAAAAAVMGSPPAAAPPVITPPVVPDPIPAPPPAAAPPSLPTPANPTTAANAAPPEASPMNPQFTTRFNEDQKVKLLAADKDREQKGKARHSSGGASPSHASAPKPSKSSTFTTGGNKYDPLNSSI
jgi:hypothetical protein